MLERKYDIASTCGFERNNKKCYLRETPLMLSNSIFRFSTSLICPFSGPFLTFSLPIR